ncbi:MAG: leucyl aminopeptidase family protein, partial [Thermoanaerobaculia bacterium]
MATLTIDSKEKRPETHFFFPVGTSPRDMPVPDSFRKKIPKAEGETFWIEPRGGASCVHMYRAGAGSALAALRSSTKAAAEGMKKRGVARARFVFSKDAAPIARALLPHLALSDYSFERYRGAGRTPRVTLAVDFPGARLTAAELKTASAIAEAAAWARDLGNTPANDLGSRQFSAIVAAVARREGLSFRSLSRAEIVREKMGGVLGVSSGSSRPPGFLILSHRPKSPRARVVLVGKGITFDSGGISIKPSASMGEMKFDMMGAATALAIVRVAHRLRIPVTVTALAPLAENVPSGTSYRPGDILRMRNGKTVEVDNTDAEGRLILADALSYSEKFAPDVLIDFATLTGAVVVALGNECAGLMSDNEALARDLLEAGEETGDRFWRLPLWGEYRDLLRSDYADMKNSGGRWGGTVSAAAFLKEFVPEGVPWAH